MHSHPLNYNLDTNKAHELLGAGIVCTKMASEPENHVEKSLQSIWAHVLNLPHVPLDQPFLSVGGDSISAMQVVGQCRKEGMSLGVQEVLRSRSLAQLATAVKEVENSSYDHQEYFDEDFDLSPIQSLYFQRPNTHGHFNQSFYLRVARRTNAIDFQAAVQQLVTRHSMLRARFSFSTERGWQQRLTSESACMTPQFSISSMYMVLCHLHFA
jgi:aryl carrier-like protein